MRNWKLTLAYDGTDFSGWQIQPGEATVQGTLQAALKQVVGEGPLPQGSGRTDAGVHALGQVASFVLEAPIPAENLRRALNRTLPAAIRILKAEMAAAGFHARHSAVAKTYEYRVFPEKSSGGEALCPPFLARYVNAYPWPLDLDRLNQAAGHFVGTYDFRSFAATDPDAATRGGANEGGIAEEPATRTIFASDWEQRRIGEGDLGEGTLLVYRVRGSGFLHHMVRNLVGTMLDVGRGYYEPAAIPGMIQARSRAAAGPTAPARGLFLHSVEYPV